MEQWIKIKGRLIYEPRREGIKKVSRDTPWWIIVQLPYDDLSNFYRRWLRNFYDIVSHPPVWGTHVTVLNGRVPVKHEFMEHWKKYDGSTVEFEYSPYIEQHWAFLTLPVRSSKLENIRKELGFEEHKPLHVTIGRLEGQRINSLDLEERDYGFFGQRKISPWEMEMLALQKRVFF